jgi:hypothetical protein
LVNNENISFDACLSNFCNFCIAIYALTFILLHTKILFLQH